MQEVKKVKRIGMKEVEYKKSRRAIARQVQLQKVIIAMKKLGTQDPALKALINQAASLLQV